MLDTNLNVAGKILNGRFKAVEFALTNVCIAKCAFCKIWKQKPKVFADSGKAKAAVERLADFGAAHLTLTGGEPLLHPDIFEIVRLASGRKMHCSVLNAAPELVIKNDAAKKLEDAGCSLICLSLDSDDPHIMAESRQIENVMAQLEQAVKIIKKTGLTVNASVLIWKNNWDRLKSVCDAANDIGFDFISLNYPTFSESEVYELGGDGIKMPKRDVVHALESAVELKKTGKYKIINTVSSMKNTIDFLNDPKSVKFHCLGGSRVLFVDWFLNAYPCMQLSKPIGPILELTEEDLRLPACNACSMSWYRDISMLLHGAKSAPYLIKALTESFGIF